MENRYKDDSGEDSTLSVDGVDFIIQEPAPYVKHISKIWWSKKHNGPGLRYELGVGIKTSDIVWVHGPFPCGQYNDCTIFNNSLSTFLDKNERVEADDGYCAADPDKVKSKSGHSSRNSSVEEIDVKNRVRARHETVNKRIKQFSSLSGIFRHDLDLHSDFCTLHVLSPKFQSKWANPYFK